MLFWCLKDISHLFVGVSVIYFESEKRLIVTYILSLDFQKQPTEVFYKKGVLKKFVKFTGKLLCWSLFFNKVAGLRPCS